MLAISPANANKAVVFVLFLYYLNYVCLLAHIKTNRRLSLSKKYFAFYIFTKNSPRKKHSNMSVLPSNKWLCFT